MNLKFKSKAFLVLVSVLLGSAVGCGKKYEIPDSTKIEKKLDPVAHPKQRLIDNWNQEHKLSEAKTEGNFIKQIAGEFFYDVSDSVLNDSLLKYILENLNIPLHEPFNIKKVDSILLLKPSQYRKAKLADLIWNEDIFLLTSDIIPYIEYPEHFSQSAYELMFPILGISHPLKTERATYLEVLLKVRPEEFLNFIKDIKLDSEKAELMILLCLQKSTGFNESKIFKLYCNYLDSLITYSEQLTHIEKAQWLIGLAKLNPIYDYQNINKHSIIALEKAMQLLRGDSILFLKPLILEISYLDIINQQYSRERAKDLLNGYIPQSIALKNPRGLTCKLYTYLALIQSKLLRSYQFDGTNITDLDYFSILQPLAQAINTSKEISVDWFDILRQSRVLANFFRLKNDYISALKFEIAGFLIINQDTSRDFERLEWITQVKRIEYCTHFLKIQSQLNPWDYHFHEKNSKAQQFLTLHFDILDEIPPELELYKFIDTSVVNPPQFNNFLSSTLLPQDIRIYQKHLFKKISAFYARKHKWEYAYKILARSDSVLLNDIPRQAFKLGANSYESSNQIDLVLKNGEIKLVTELSKQRKKNLILSICIGSGVLLALVIIFIGWRRVKAKNKIIAMSELKASLLANANNQLSHISKKVPLNLTAALESQDKNHISKSLYNLSDFFELFYEYSKNEQVDIEHEIKLCKKLVNLEFPKKNHGLSAGDRIIIKQNEYNQSTAFPPLIIFNIIYNSFKHGKIAESIVNGRIYVRITKLKDRFFFSIIDSGENNHESKRENVGTGLDWSKNMFKKCGLSIEEWHNGARKDGKRGYEVSFYFI